MNLSQLLRSGSILVVASIANFAPRAAAQCAAWTGGFHFPGVDGTARAAVVFDDGSGPALYVGGNFDSAAGSPARNLARWDGTAWSEVGGGVDTAGVSEIRALAVHDDGSGPALYVGGSFVSVGAGVPAANIAKWNGSTWSALASGVGGGAVECLLSFDDGGGSKLFVGGWLTSAGGNPASLVAAWDGSAWSALGAGLSSTLLNARVLTFAAYDEGAGARLFAGGYFNHAEGTIPVTSIARWNGASWSAVNAQPFGGGAVLESLLAFDDGSGAALYASGTNLHIDGTLVPSVVRWNGSTWSGVGTTFAPSPNVGTALAAFDLGSGPQLVTSGGQTSTRLIAWNGSSWSYVSDGLAQAVPYSVVVESLCVFDEGFGPALFAVGNFNAAAGAPLSRVARFTGGAWSGVGSGDGVSDEVLSLCSATASPDGGAALYVGGSFLGAGDVTANRVARWDGTLWHPLGAGVSISTLSSWDAVEVRALLVHDDGSGPVLYAGGNFRDAGGALVNNVARWNGASWSALGSGFDAPVDALAFYDDGTGEALYAGGEFTASGATSVSHIARWNGVAWQPLGVGVSGGSEVVKTFLVHDDGSGVSLFVGGGFTQAGGLPAARIARWNGSSWSALGNGVSAMVNALAVFDSGAGSELCVGGQFVTANGTAVYNIARWNGSTWSGLGAGFDHFVLALQVYDDGSGGGQALFAAGRFEHMATLAIDRVAKWDGSSWSSAGGPDAAVKALAVFDDPTTPWPELYAGGRFDNAAGESSRAIARYANACACQATTYCTAGTTSNGCVPSISGIGAASASSPNGFTIRIDDVEGQKQGHIAYSITGPNANPWSPLSSSFLCIKAPTQRTPTQNSNGTNGACDGVVQIDWNDYIATHPGALGTPLTVGTQVWAQLYFRDPPAPKTTNLSNGLTFFVCP